MFAIKIYEVPSDLESFFNKIRQLKVDSVFLGDSAIKTKDFMQELNKRSIKTYFVFRTFYNPEYLKEHPDSYALVEDGTIAKDEWVEFVCPTNPDYINYLLNRIEQVINEYNPYGISLDFIRQFIFWEKVLDKNSFRIKKACCCSRCINDSRNNEEVITDIVKLLSEKARKVNPDIVVDLHAVPWKSDEYRVDGMSLAGQNLRDISKYVNFITPMCYSHMLNKSSSWINNLVRDQYNQAGIPIIPAIQAKECYFKEELTPEKYQSILEAAVKQPSSGVIIWSWDNISSGKKFDITKEVLSNCRFDLSL